MNEKLKVFCNQCNTNTNHTIKCEHKVNDIVKIELDGEFEEHFIGTYLYQIIECNGCETISYRSVDSFNDFVDFDTEKGLIKNGTKTFQTVYPERLTDALIEKKIVGIPILLRKTYSEVIDSYNFNHLILCAAGLRAIVEGICTHYGFEGQYLKDKINQLGDNGFISKDLSESLNLHKNLGNHALHRLIMPEKSELKSAIHLLELTLETLFGVPDRHQKLKNAIKKRLSEQKKSE
jgi:hypothetical protein